MPAPAPDAIIATLAPAPSRLWVAVAITGALGVLLVALSINDAEGGFVARLFLLALGAAAFWQSWRLGRVSDRALLLTSEAIHDQDGAVLVRLSDVVGVNRGAFAIKPSGGFTLVTRERLPRGGVPGLWWARRRRFGVGGLTPQGPARFMAEAIALRLAAG